MIISFPGSSRTHRVAYISAICFICIVLWNLWLHDRARSHVLHVDVIRDAIDGVLLRQDDAQDICRLHHLSTFNNEQQRKVYDLFLLSTELDWLEIRLHTLAPFVDYFVIVESPTTFTGKKKPLYLRDNWERFQEFHHQIIYRVVEDHVVSTSLWAHEDFFRNSLLNEVFPSLADSAQEARHGDVLVVSDIDEIIRPEAILVMRYCEIPARLTLHTDFYYYSFQWQHQGPQWAHPDATVFKGLQHTLPPNDLRAGLLGPGWTPIAAFLRWWDRGSLRNAGWHCSSCFATIAEMRTKMHSFSHQGWNTADNRDATLMMNRVRSGQDLFGRPNEHYNKIESNLDVPIYISQQYSDKGRFKYMLDRDGEDAGFEDWQTIKQND